MPTYAVSPFSKYLQSYIYKSTDLSAGGAVDVFGTTPSVYAIQIRNGDSATRYVAFWDGTSVVSEDADVMIRMDAAKTNMTVYIDKGIPFTTACTVNASASFDNGGATTDFDVTLFAT